MLFPSAPVYLYVKRPKVSVGSSLAYRASIILRLLLSCPGSIKVEIALLKPMDSSSNGVSLTDSKLSRLGAESQDRQLVSLINCVAWSAEGNRLIISYKSCLLVHDMWFMKVSYLYP